MKKQVDSILVIIGFALFAYLLLARVEWVVGIVVLFSLLIFFVIQPIQRQVNAYEVKLRDMNQFVTQVIIQISATSSVFETLATVKNSLPIEWEEELDLNTTIDRIKFYFQDSHLTLFLDLLRAYDETGGNFIETSELIISDLLYKKYSFAKFKLIKQQKMMNLFSLWGLSFIVFIYFRFGLERYYKLLLEQAFMGVILLILIAFMASLWLAYLHYGKLKGVEAYEKRR